MLNIVLFEPEIPPNTGNIIRLCANSGARLHLIHPLGFHLNERHVRRAGLDYHDMANIIEHINFSEFLSQQQPNRLFGCTTKAKTCYSNVAYQVDDYLLFGPETRGLPDSILNSLPLKQKLRIPMKPHSRSLNLSNACAIILFEAWRQLNFSANFPS